MNIIEILKENHLRRTACREGILLVLTKSNETMSENEIKAQLGGNYDRTTFYRSFKTLADSGLLHKVVVDGQQIKYGFSAPFSKNLNHAHFYCHQCKTIVCLDLPLAIPKLPVGFLNQETEIIVKGLCKNCNQNAAN